MVLFVLAGPATQVPGLVQILGPLAGATLSGTLNITGHASDSLVITAVRAKVDSGAWVNAVDTSWKGTWGTWAATWNTTGVKNGPHTITASIWDSWGEAAAAVVQVQVANPPWVHIQSPTNDSLAAGYVTILGGAGNVGPNDTVKFVQVAVDPQVGNPVWQNATPFRLDWGLWQFSWDAGLASPGWHTVIARAYDGYLYSNPSSDSYFVGYVPFSQIVSPSFDPPQTVDGRVTVRGIAGDMDRVTLVAVRLDDGAWTNATDTSLDASWSTWSYAWNTSQSPEGAHWLCSVAWDGNQSSVAACGPVYVRNDWVQPPAVSIAEPRNGDTVSGLVLMYGTAVASSRCTNCTSTIWLVQVQIDAVAWQRATATGGGDPWSSWAFEWNTTILPNGQHQACVIALAATMYSAPACITAQVQNRRIVNAASQPLTDTLLTWGVPSWMADFFAGFVSGGYLPVFLIPGVLGFIFWLRSQTALK